MEKLIETETLGSAFTDPPTFGSLEQWWFLGGSCYYCHHQGWLDRYELMRRYGKDTYIIRLSSKLKCLGCGNREHNSFIVGRMPR